jgi:chloramphenicol 3-O phosphotransferase
LDDVASAEGATLFRPTIGVPSYKASTRRHRKKPLNTTARIVLLNGVGSAGKGSIAKALQTITTDPFLHVEMDAFLQMLPQDCVGHPDGITIETVPHEGKPEVVIRTGPVADRAFRGMRHAIAAMAAQGNNLIVDDVIVKSQMAEYASLLSAFDFFAVGVFAPLNILEARERQRGDRMIGLARWQYDRVHKGMRYDLELDTSSATPIECAKLIKRKFGL